MRFALRFDPKRVREWASQFDASGDRVVEEEVAPRMRAAGRLDRDDFLAITSWKSPRARKRCEENSASFVEAVTATALSTPDERLRVEVLLLLRGVNWPTASVILHFGHREPYPILDVRALWSAGVDDPPAYTFEFWREYTEFCRALARRARVSMRDLDRALWQFSKSTQ